jgi:hypothetical protein
MTTVKNQNVVFTSYIGSDYSLSIDGALGVGLNNTPILNTLPTTTTSSIGTYFMRDKNASKIINACGSGDGNIHLCTVSSTAQPLVLLQADKDGTTCPSFKSISNGNTMTIDSTSLNFNNVKKCHVLSLI